MLGLVRVRVRVRSELASVRVRVSSKIETIKKRLKEAKSNFLIIRLLREL